MAPSPLKICTLGDQHELVLSYLKQQARGKEIKILEAGCGRKWHFDLQGTRYQLTGIDMDAHALESRKNQEKDLDEAILGDLRTVDIAPNTFDVIYNAYVLEHVQGAKQVLENFARWLKPGGVLIVYVPDRHSAYGFFAHHTPHWVHVFFYRYVLGNPDAGKPGHVPYPTIYDEIVSRKGIREFARLNQLVVREERGFYKPSGLASFFLDFIHTLSFGTLAGSHCNLLYVIEKPVS